MKYNNRFPLNICENRENLIFPIVKWFILLTVNNNQDRFLIKMFISFIYIIDLSINDINDNNFGRVKSNYRC